MKDDSSSSPNIQKIKDEENDFYTNDDLFTISSWGADLSFRELIDRYKEESLVKPELQRKYVWDKTEASRFIESVLLGLPVPSIFLAKTEDERFLIVDGYQRIMTVYDFVSGIFSKDKKVFRLSKSKKIHSRYQGKAFSELDDQEQRKIKNTTIHAIIFVQQHPSKNNTSIFQIFERINTSGRTLLPQEIRNCIYQGNFNDLLFELNEDKTWRRLFGKKEADPRMRDMEFILRFFAIADLINNGSSERERISLKKYLNEYMAENKDIDDFDCGKLRARFLASIECIHENFGDSAFHNISPTKPNQLTKKFNPTIFDSITVAADTALHSTGMIIPNKPERRRRELLANEDYSQAISKETMRTDAIQTRVDLARKELFGVDQ